MNLKKKMSIFRKIIFLFFIISPAIANSYELEFRNLNKLNLNDIQIITSKDISNNNFSDLEISSVINDLYKSDLIFDVSYSLKGDKAIISILESKVINSVFITGNLFLKDDNIFNIIKSQKNNLLSRDNLNYDIKTIKNLYLSQGYESVSISTLTEEFSEDRVNLIFKINEGYQSKISNISFEGNRFYSDRYIRNLIKAESVGMFSIFKSGSNLNQELFNFDKSKIIQDYKNKGFFDVEVSYELTENIFNNYQLIYFIKENEREMIEKVNYSLITNELNDFISKGTIFFKY